MGDDIEYVRPYCSTLYRTTRAGVQRARPAECEFHDLDFLRPASEVNVTH